MLRTDPITLHLLEKFAEQEEKKSTYEETLHHFVAQTRGQVLQKLNISTDDAPATPDSVIGEITGEMIKNKIHDEISGALQILAKTLALACDVGNKSTPKKRKKLAELAGRAIALERVKIEIIENALKAADFTHIAENLLRIGSRKKSTPNPDANFAAGDSAHENKG